jgi:circadian clock protein KaiB
MEEKWILVLYLAGMTPAGQRALANVTAICDKHLKGRYSVEVIDLIDRPALAQSDQIFAVPTLVRRHPGPIRKMIGDLSNHEKVVAGMGLPEAGAGNAMA